MDSILEPKEPKKKSNNAVILLFVLGIGFFVTIAILEPFTRVNSDIRRGFHLILKSVGVDLKIEDGTGYRKEKLNPNLPPEIGQSSHQVGSYCGAPDHINRTQTANRDTRMWFYNSNSTSRCRNNSYFFVNNKLETISSTYWPSSAFRHNRHRKKYANVFQSLLSRPASRRATRIENLNQPKQRILVRPRSKQLQFVVARFVCRIWCRSCRFRKRAKRFVRLPL